MSKKLYENQDHYCWVYQEGDEYFLDTVCGGAGLYAVTLRMTPDEVEEFRKDPTTVVDLSRDVCYRQDFYRDRIVNEAMAIKLRTSAP